jgi:hypothetical protein
MIEPIIWPRQWHDELASPFMRGTGERNLRVTLDSGSLVDLSPEDAEAVSMLRDLGHLPEIDLLTTDPTDRQYLEIDFESEDEESISVRVIRGESPAVQTWVENPRSLRRMALKATGRDDISSPDVVPAFRWLATAMSHEAVGFDIFVTASPWMTTDIARTVLRDTNARTPLDALKIVGLFLRSRGVFTCRAHMTIRGEWFYYWALARHYLPSMWRYFAACLRAGENTGAIAQSTIKRASRALQARDAIGVQFYQPQDNDTVERTMYHFDYLTLLLSGAFDAQARIARRAYGITRPAEGYTSFRNREFLCKLHDVADGLHSIVTEEHAGLLDLVSGIRNTIHGATLQGLASGGARHRGPSYIDVPPHLFKDGRPRVAPSLDDQTWGWVSNIPMHMYEPYSFSIMLVQQCLKALNDIAAATDVDKLPFRGSADTPLLAVAPNDGGFQYSREFALLG